MPHKETFLPEKGGLVLMTDNSCNKFRFGVEDNLFCHQTLNDSTSFYKHRNIAKNDNSNSEIWHNISGD